MIPRADFALPRIFTFVSQWINSAGGVGPAWAADAAGEPARIDALIAYR